MLIKIEAFAVLFHLHPPKTGGKTIETYLQRLLNEDLVRVSRYFPEVSVSDVSLYAEKFKISPKILPVNSQVVTGHYCYGLHEALGRPAKYVSIIRDPVARLKSYYNYILNSDDYFIKDFITTNGITFCDFAHFGDKVALSGYPAEFDIMLENGQTRLLSGITGRLSNPVTQKEFSRACKNISDGYLFLAPTERATDALIAICLHLEKNLPLTYHPVNVSTIDHVGDVDQDLQEYIWRRNNYDALIYEMAVSSFDDYIKKNNLSAYIFWYKKILKYTGGSYELVKKASLSFRAG